MSRCLSVCDGLEQPRQKRPSASHLLGLSPKRLTRFLTRMTSGASDCRISAALWSFIEVWMGALFTADMEAAVVCQQRSSVSQL